jgi:hypothetical protein
MITVASDVSAQRRQTSFKATETPTSTTSPPPQPQVTIVGLSKVRSSMYKRTLFGAFNRALTDINKNSGFSFRVSPLMVELDDYSPFKVLKMHAAR